MDVTTIPLYRKLLYHPESDCYWEVFTEKEYLEDMQDGWTEDVTGEPRHENEFKQQNKEQICKQ